MKWVNEDFIWGIMISVLVLTLFIIVSLFSQFPATIYNIIFLLMTIDMVTMLYYISYISRTKLTQGETKEELRVRLNLIELGKKEAEKRYYNRMIGDKIYNKIMQDYEQEDINLRSKLKNLKLRK
ncbi:MAG: hypothetical protein DRP06_01810 [Candidatus Aenigmatarchaeota archaeon]|nr:MAG: hypothetical protein DRP06_01810 [Candidatus Aenigmarchaeota archaeon]